MPELTVWGGYGFVSGIGQVRMIVATFTKKRAMELIGISSYKQFNDYWCETGNQAEILAALKSPGEVLFKTDKYISKQRWEIQ